MTNLCDGPIAMQISVTYRCNAACKWCVQHLDQVRWGVDTDVTTEEIRIAASLLKRFGVQIGKLRVTGGEPCVHPRLKEVCEEIDRSWSPRASSFRVYSNGKLPLPWGRRGPGRFSVVPLNGVRKTQGFASYSVSPADLGIEPEYGFLKPCGQQVKCGRWFDCFGFTSCGVSGVLGAMLGDDCYEPLPVMLGRPSVCQHCFYSLRKSKRAEITKGVREGKIPDVTKTFERAVERWHDDPPRPRRFLERLPAEYLPGGLTNAKRRGRSTRGHEGGASSARDVSLQCM